MTTLVTGATGFVGSAVARRLLAAGHEVRVLARPGSDLRNLDGLNVQRVQGDLRDAATLERAVAGCQFLFHVAADYRLWARDPRELYTSNVEGTRDLMRAAGAAGVERIVYTSSVATLGHTLDGSPADENTPVTETDMIGDYKRSKFRAEEVVRELVRSQGLPVVIVNPSAPFGPRDIKPTPTGRVVVQAASGRLPAYVDTGLNVVHVDDVAEGEWLAFERGRVGERYVLGGEDMSLADILSRVASVAGRSPPRIRLAPAAVLPVAYLAEAWARLTGSGEPMATVSGVRMSTHRMFYSSAKARRELGYRPRPAAEALADAVHWFQRHGYC